MDKDEFVITAGDDTMQSSPSTDAFDISSIDLSSLTSDTITLDNSALTAASGLYSTTISTNGTGPSYNWNSGGYSFPAITSIGSTNGPGMLKCTGDAEFDGDVKVQGHSILHLMKKLEDRLAILQEPDPEKLEKFAALKKAYEHYKTLERLIGDN